MEDKYLERIESIVKTIEMILGLEDTCSLDNESGESILVKVKELSISDCYRVTLEEMKASGSEMLKSTRVEILKELMELPSITLRLAFLNAYKLNLSIIPITQTVSEVLVSLTDSKSVSVDKLKNLNAIISCITLVEETIPKSQETLEYRLFRLTLLLAGISCPIGACYLADLILKQAIISED